MVNNNPVKINLDDLIKLSHIDVLDYLIKRSAEEVEKLDKFDIEAVAEIIAEQYTHLFQREFLKRYEDTISNHVGPNGQLIVEQ